MLSCTLSVAVLGSMAAAAGARFGAMRSISAPVCATLSADAISLTSAAMRSFSPSNSSSVSDRNSCVRAASSSSVRANSSAPVISVRGISDVSRPIRYGSFPQSSSPSTAVTPHFSGSRQSAVWICSGFVHSRPSGATAGTVVRQSAVCWCTIPPGASSSLTSGSVQSNSPLLSKQKLSW